MCHVGRVGPISDDKAPQLVRRTFEGLHSGSWCLGVINSSIWESRLIVKVYTSAQSKTGISAVLTVMSGLGILCIKDDDLCLFNSSLFIVFCFTLLMLY